jgi:antitoxin PrlF
VAFVSTTVTSKGRVTVPKSVREYLGLKAGSAVAFERVASGEIVLRPVKRPAKPRAGVFSRLRGRATVRMNTEEILALRRGQGLIRVETNASGPDRAGLTCPGGPPAYSLAARAAIGSGAVDCRPRGLYNPAAFSPS